MGDNKDTAHVAEGKITDEALAKFKSRIGKTIRIREQGNELVCNETIIRFARGVGDVNPLWNDPEYAGTTRYKCLVAPPSWLYSVVGAGSQQGLKGVHGFHSGDDWEFYRPILLNDRIKCEEIFTGVDDKKSSFARRMIIEHRDRMYTNQHSELVAKAKGWIIRIERGEAKEKGKYSKIQVPHPWTDEELKKIEQEVLNEEIRGDQVRYWEDVNVGDVLPQCIKGPLGMTDEIAFIAGNGGLYLRAHRAALEEYARHPAWAFRDPNTFSLDPMSAVHYNRAVSLATGLPYPYAIGVQMQSWDINLLTNWMGDEGWLKKCYCEYRKFVYFSDVVWLKGEVTGKYVDENNEYCVDIETSGFNQRGENVMPGRSTVILPSREYNTYPIQVRLEKAKTDN
ncbi:MAG: MaoC family dehydratase N-terminal domain-containing protein [Dehalococcoidia bacterium]